MFAITERIMRVLGGIKILVVDDELDARELVEAVLTTAGATVSTAPSAQVALELLPSFEPHVVVSDIGMPEQDGYSLIETIRRLPRERGGAVAALALTAFAREVDRVRALSCGFDGHLAKPVDPRELTRVVGHLVATSRPAPS